MSLNDQNTRYIIITSDMTKFETCPENQTKITRYAVNEAIADIKVSQPELNK